MANKWSKYKNWNDYKTDPRKTCWIGNQSTDISWHYWNLYYPEDLIYHGDGYLIHHVDDDHRNNSKENLMKMILSEHISLHHKGKIISEHQKKKQSTAMIGKHPSLETLKKLSEKQKGKQKGNNYSAKPIRAEFQNFLFLKAAGEYLKVDPTTIFYRIKTRKPGYCYIKIEEKK